jgi:glucose/arabinose dehydrogenase
VNVLREAPDQSGRIFVNDLRGPLYVVEGTLLHLYLDLSAELPLKTSPNIGTGFVSFALHPEFASNGLFYSVHTEAVGAISPNLGPALASPIDQHSVLSEWRASDPEANVFAGTRRELIRVAAITTSHNLGEIAFDPTANADDPDFGLLYIGAGDFGSAHDGQSDQLQRIDSVYGALLRIDPLGDPFLRSGILYDYGIPVSNPFSDMPGALGEIFAYGFRNAHRLSWDHDGVLLVSDIGEAQVEEVNLVMAGDNFGWPAREGSFAIDVETNPNAVFPLPPEDPVPYRYPVAQYDHEEGRAIAGGFVYRGRAIPALWGRFVFGDIPTGRIFYADVDELLEADDGDPATTAQIFELGLLREGNPTTLLDLVRAATGRPFHPRTDLRFGVNRSGELYVTTKQDGFVRRLLPDMRPDCSNGFDDDGDGDIDFPDDLGCFDAASLEEDPECQDGLDNDGRRGTDFDGGESVLGAGNGDRHGPDPQCVGTPWRDREAKLKKRQHPWWRARNHGRRFHSSHDHGASSHSRGMNWHGTKWHHEVQENGHARSRARGAATVPSSRFRRLSDAAESSE